MVRRILLGLAGTQYSAAATEMALDVALRRGARVTGMTVVDAPRLARVGSQPIGAGAYAKELRDHRVVEMQHRVDEVVDEFIAACEAAGVPFTIRREERETPFDYFISQARYHDLTVLGLRGIFEYGVIGEPLEDPGLLLARLVSEGVRPILAAGSQFTPIKRVLVAYSGSMESAKTLKHFVHMQPWRPEQLRIVTFQRDPERGVRLLADAADYCQAHELEVETACLTGNPKDSLLPEAQAWEADLIVLGNSARNLLRRQMFGETALHVMQHAEIPLFLGQ